MLKSDCYDNSGDECLEDMKDIDLYTVSDKSTTKVPRSRQCVKCGKYLSINGPYIKFYNNIDDKLHNLAFISNVQDINNKINKFKNNYYSISDGYQVQLFENKNYNDNSIGNSIWLPLKNTNIKDKYKVSDLEPKYRNFRKG